MFLAPLTIMLVAANPSLGCADGVEEMHAGPCLCETLHRQIDYHKRLYYGHFDRHPFDYRFQFDYPWHAGPSQPRWPIPPLPVVDADLGAETLPIDHVPSAAARRIATPVVHRADPPAAGTTLTFRRSQSSH